MISKGIQHWEYWTGDFSNHPEIKQLSDLGLISSPQLTLAIPVGRYGEPYDFDSYSTWRMGVRDELEQRLEAEKENLHEEGGIISTDIALSLRVWNSYKDAEDLGPVEFVETDLISRLVDMNKLINSTVLASLKYTCLRHESINFSDVEDNTRRLDQ